MHNLISTETVILISLLGKRMPNLFKYIVQYSTPQSGKKIVPKSTRALSSEQIEQARQHPNNIISEALSTIATIQAALNTTMVKTNELLEQRNKIENILVAILSTENKK